MVNVQKLFVLFLFSVIIFSCTRDILTEVSCDPLDVPVYDGEVESIINATCAYTGCHISGFTNGDYSDYDKIVSSDLDQFLAEISNGDMPPVYSSGPTTLTAEELMTLQCWIKGGTLEN